MKHWRQMIPLLVLLLLVAACSQKSATPIPPAPTASDSLETAVTPTMAVQATPLPIPPTLAATTAAPTNTPEAAAPEAILLLTAADFGADRNPLTGELVADPMLLQRRPLAVKISNAPAIYTRPQSGLNDADLVFEHTTEGAITRFTAIFYGKTPPRIGPVRSARLIDLELPAMYDAGLVFSGASAGVRQKLYNSDFAGRINEGGFGLYRTGENKPYEHTLYGNPEQLWQELAAKGQNTPPAFRGNMAFGSEPPGGGSPASQVTIDYGWTVVEWRYDPEIGRYRRWADGEIHADGNTGEQVTAANVIVLSPYHVEDPTICEEIRDGVCAHLSVQIQLWGSGSGAVFRDGQRYDVTWRRLNRNDLLTFTDSAGDPFPLQIGNSWVQVVPSWLNNPLTVNP